MCVRERGGGGKGMGEVHQQADLSALGAHHVIDFFHVKRTRASDMTLIHWTDFNLKYYGSVTRATGLENANFFQGNKGTGTPPW